MPALKTSGSTPMPTRFERWMRSKLSTITALTPSSNGPLAAQSRDEPVPYSLPPNIDQRHALLLVAHRRVVDRHLLAGRIVLGDAAFDARHHLVLDADVGERAAHHYFVIAAPGAVAVEVPLLDPMRDEIFAGGSCLLDGAGRADVIGCQLSPNTARTRAPLMPATEFG